MRYWRDGLLALSLLGLLLPGALLADEEAGSGKKVGVMWVTRSGPADRVSAGFSDRMGETAPGVDEEFATGLADDATAREVYKRFQAEKDAMLFLRSHGAQWLAANPPRVPSFICASRDAEEILAQRHTQSFNPGVTLTLPIDVQFDFFLQQLFPDLKSVALFTTAGHPGSAREEADTRAACAKRGIACEIRSCEGKSAVVAAVKSLRDEVDLFILGSQNLLIDNSAVVATLAPRTPIMSYSERAVGHGALGGLVADETKLGRLLAESVCAVLLEGRPVGAVAVKSDPEPRLIVDIEKMFELGLILPPALAEMAEEI